MLHTILPSSGARQLGTAHRPAAAGLLRGGRLAVGSHGTPGMVPHATRDVGFSYQKDIQTKLKPGVFADRMDDKPSHLASAPDWQTVLRLFMELGEDTNRNISLVGDMLVSLQRLVPAGAGAGAGAGAAAAAGGGGARLSPQESKQLALGISNMCEVLLDNITRVNNKLLINVVWALALLQTDPAKALQTPAAAAARARAVGGFGAAVITRTGKLTAEEVFHVYAGLALLGFKPPRTLTRDQQQKAAEGSKNAQLQPGTITTSSSSMKFGALLERRSIKVMHYLSPKSIADAGFVMSRLVAHGDVSTEWLALYAKASKQHLASMQPEALVYAGYAFARHSFKPSNSWQKAYVRALEGIASTLAGEEFPLVLFTLARWRQQQQQQQQQDAAGGQQQPRDQSPYEGEESEDYDGEEYGGSGGSSSDTSSSVGPAVPQSLIDDLLLTSYRSRALRELPLGQLVVMVKSLAELNARVDRNWMQRLWPLVNAKIDGAVAAEASSSSQAGRRASPGDASSAGSASVSAGSLAGDLAALLAAIPHLQPVPDLPADFVEGLVGNLGLGLQQLNTRQLAAAWVALQQLGHEPDAIFQRQLQAALLAAVPKAASSELPALLQLGLAVGLGNSGDISRGSSVRGLLQPEAFCEQLLHALVAEVSRRVDLAAGRATAPAAAGARLAQQQERQQQLAGAAADGLWQLPQALAACVQHVSSSSSSALPAAAAAVLQAYVPQLQQLFSSSAAALAAVMPTEPLLVQLGFLLDMPEQQAQMLGFTSSSSSSSKQAAVSAVLEAGVYGHLDSTVPAGRRGAAAAAVQQLGGVTDVNKKNLLVDFSVPDFLELLVVISDAQLQRQVPLELLDVAAEALHGALAPKGPAYGFGCSADDAADLVRELLLSFGYDLPAKVKSRYKKWAGPEALPEELTARRKKASSSKGGMKKAAAAPAVDAAVQAAAAAVPAVAAQGAAAAAMAMQPPAAPAAPAAVPAAPAAAVIDGDDGVVCSSRSRLSTEV